MPPYSIIEDEKLTKLNILAYGPAKCRKTWWAIKAIESNFNVVIFNCDLGLDIIKNLDPIARRRLLVIDLPNNPDNPPAPRFFGHLLRRKAFCWDEISNQRVLSQVHYNPAHSHYWIDPSKFTRNDIAINDSYTLLTEQTYQAAALEKGIDLSIMGDDDNDKRGIYGYAANYMNWILENYNGLGCHWITIAHQDHYEKVDTTDKKKPKVLLSRIQPKSTSGPHGMQVAAKFSDILYFRLLSERSVKIETIPYQDQDGGCRNLPPKVHSWDDLTFPYLCQEAGVCEPNTITPFEAIKWYPPGEIPAELPETNVTNRPLPNTGNGAAVQSSTVKVGGLAAKLAEKKANREGENA